jgi:stage II sporulation protein D
MQKLDRLMKQRFAVLLSITFISAMLTVGIAKMAHTNHDVSIETILPNPQRTLSISKDSGTFQRTKLTNQEEAALASFIVPIYLSQKREIARVPLEKYIAGVVAAEMPVNFELEALKAQAMAARTYIMRRMVNQDRSGMPVKNAWVTDTVAHQAYLTEQQLKKNWGKAYKTNMARINQAISETQGLIITYDNKPINATYFSTSNGYTENSEDYWGVYEPYLRSVSSPWDSKISPIFNKTIQMPLKQFLSKLGLTQDAIPVSLSTAPKTQLSQGQRVSKINIAGKLFTGKEIRERLALSSSAFTWERNGNTIEIKTLGSGHGVGMSQWGANGMAKEGKAAEEIIQYYYKGIEIQSALNFTGSIQ